MAAGGQSCDVSTAAALDHRIAVIHRAAEVCGRAARDATANRSVIEHDDLAARLREMIGNRQPRDAGPDYDDIRDEISIESGVVWQLDGCGPNGIVFGKWCADSSRHALNTRRHNAGVRINT